MKIKIIDFRDLKTYGYARPTMFFVDGIRVSKERYHHIRRNAAWKKHWATRMWARKKGNIRLEYQEVTVN